jgi:hypothetical protein
MSFLKMFRRKNKSEKIPRDKPITIHTKVKSEEIGSLILRLFSTNVAHVASIINLANKYHLDLPILPYQIEIWEHPEPAGDYRIFEIQVVVNEKVVTSKKYAAVLD